MSESFSFDVFLSHSAKDKAVVRQLAKRLKGDGVKVWFDEEELKPGDSIPAKIEEGLEHSRVLLLCMSVNAFGSEWAQLESGTFRFRDPLNKARRFIPLRLDDAQIKGSLSQFLYIDWGSPNREGEYAKLLESCQSITLHNSSELYDAKENLQLRLLSFGHTGPVHSVHWSPDKRFAISGSEDNILRLWDMDGGQCLRVLEGHTDAVMSAAWSPNGLQILSGSLDRLMRLWDAVTGKCLRVLEGHTDAVMSVAWSPDGMRALSGAQDHTVRLWDTVTGNCKQVLKGHRGTITSVAWSPDGMHALSGAHDNTVRLWDAERGRCLRVLEGHSDNVWSVAWSPDGTRALSGSADHSVRMWDTVTWSCERVLKGHRDSVMSVTWSPDGARALSGSFDNTMRLWDAVTWRCERVLKGHAGSVWSVAWSPDGAQALSGSADQTVRLWDMVTGKCERVLEGHTDHVSSMVLSPDGAQALSSSNDNTVRLWDVETGKCLRVLEGHTAAVWSVVWSPDGAQVLSGAADSTVRLWDAGTGKCLRVLKDHTDPVMSVAWSPDGMQTLSGSMDQTVRLWDAVTWRCDRVFKGHKSRVVSVRWSPDGMQALSGSLDQTVRLWDTVTGKCLRVLEGHTDAVFEVAWSPDGAWALSGSADNTVRLWDTVAGTCERVLEGHTDFVRCVAWSPDGARGISGSSDQTVQLWDVKTGECEQVLDDHTSRVISVEWRDGQLLSGASNGVWRALNVTRNLASGPANTRVNRDLQYTNAKILLVGDTNAGKTGLAHRLATGDWKPSEDSTVGAWSTQWSLKGASADLGVDREIWLWDFGGQADQRLIHQLYMDRTALVLLLFNADQDDVLPGLRDWQAALRRCVKNEIPHFIVAGRIDTGFKASRGKLQAFAKKEGLAYHETSAKSGEGCENLRKEMISKITWGPIFTSPRIFKLIKDEIMKLRDEKQVLHTFKELRELLWRRLPEEPRFTDETLKTVIGLLDGPGVVKELDYGTYILLAPEWINAYAQAVIRTLRSSSNDLGCLALRSIADGNLIYQSIGRDGVAVEMERLPRAEERVVLGEMERQMEQRGLCLRQGDKLVFPSHCGRDRPAVVGHPSVFVSYTLKGFLDDIYTTLVVKLADSESFEIKDLWRDAADFTTLEGDHHMGIKLTRASASDGEISIYFAKGVTPEQQVIFANYIHAHLESKSEQPQRLRHYICPKCHTPKGNPQVLMEKLLAKKKDAVTTCDKCDERFALWDSLEKKFASDAVRKQVEEMQADDLVRLTTRRKGKLLVLDVGARITSANQKWIEVPGDEDDGIDMIVEFTDEEGNGVGKGLCLQLKAGNGHLRRRKSDGVEVFAIKDQRWIKTWTNQAFPVMLVIGTFPEEDQKAVAQEKIEFSDVRWMEITSVLLREGANGTKPVTQIEFKGEDLNMSNVRKWRSKILERDCK